MCDINLFTFNCFSGKCEQFDSICKIKKPILHKKEPTLLFTQESPFFNDRIDNSICNYNLVSYHGENDNFIGMYSNEDLYANNVRAKFGDSEPIKLYTSDIVSIGDNKPKKNFSKRYAILNLYKKILIANLHLDGGRFTDQYFLFNTAAFITYKLKLLHEVLKHKPGIILGDFNSIYHTDSEMLKDFLEMQYTYFADIKKSELTDSDREAIAKLNSAPYDLLKEHGYTYAKPENEGLYTNGRGKTIIDTVWYKPELLEVVSSKILSILKDEDDYNTEDCISDHNPVFVQFNIKQKLSGGKKSKHKLSKTKTAKTKLSKKKLSKKIRHVNH